MLQKLLLRQDGWARKYMRALWLAIGNTIKDKLYD